MSAAPALNSVTSLRPEDIKKHAEFGIPLEILLVNNVHWGNNQQNRTVDHVKAPSNVDCSGVVYERLSPVTGYCVGRRVRLDNPPHKTNGKEEKYRSTWGDRPHLFFASGTKRSAKELLADPETTIAPVEAEKSALAVTAYGERNNLKLLGVAIGGCFGWRSKQAKSKLGTNGKYESAPGPLPDLDFFDSHPVILLPDANYRDPRKREVRKGWNDLAAELKKPQRKCKVSMRIPPQAKNVNGPDDYIKICGDQAMAELLTGPDESEGKVKQSNNSHSSGNSTEFELRENGVYYTDNDGEDHWICAPLRIVARTCDERGESWGIRLEWCDRKYLLHAWTMPLELLAGDGMAVRARLLDSGLSIAPGRIAKEKLLAYLQTYPVDQFARCVNHLGWQEDDVYVLPSGTIGQGAEKVFFQSASAVEPAFSTHGSSPEWRDHVARLGQGNSRVILAICAAFAPPLLKFANENSGGIHLCGPSSMGKTTLLYVAASVWGHPLRYCRQWRATINGLEGLAALHNDGILILDEFSQIDPREAGEAAYLLANGLGKQRSSRDGSARQPMQWLLLFLSSGEKSLASHMSLIGRKPSIGQEIRLAEFDADAGKGLGVFEDLHEYPDSHTFADMLKEAACHYYGKVGEVWLRYLIQERREIEDALKKGIWQFLNKYAAKQNGQIQRVAKRFALIAIAGEFATRALLTGWEKGEAMEAVGQCFEAWRESFGGNASNREVRDLLAQVKAFFEVHGDSRFEIKDSTDDQRIVNNRAGFFHFADSGHREYWVFQEVFKDEICKGFPERWALRVLRETGWIIPDSSGKNTQPQRMPGTGGRSRVFVTGPKMWESEDDEEGGN